jgi:hypothetical protein
MSNLKLATTLRNARLDAITTFTGGSAILKIYSGSQPAGGGSETTVLAQLTCNATFAPAAASGVLTLNGITADSSANANGTATWFRIYKSDGTTFVLDGDVSTQSAGTGDLQLDNTSIVLGGTVALGGPNTFTEANAA